MISPVSFSCRTNLVLLRQSAPASAQRRHRGRGFSESPSRLMRLLPGEQQPFKAA